MPFGEAIPVNRVAQSFNPSMKRERSPMSWGRMSKQTVNISEETMMKSAREKLGRAIVRKVEYNRHGEYRDATLPGRFLSVRV